MAKNLERTCFLLFFVSGFCGLLYQTIWVRLAFASFGVITPVLSVILSAFMLGLALGSWGAGKLVPTLTAKFKISAVVLYAGVEALIGIGALAVPGLFLLARNILLGIGQSNSSDYLLISGVSIALILLPWCICMGATFPLMMAFVREIDNSGTRAFSNLYLANCAGAMAGTIVTAFILIEILGFRGTLLVGAVGNFSIALVSGIFLSKWSNQTTLQGERHPEPTSKKKLDAEVAFILLLTGFAAMAMEVVWTRAFIFVLGQEVYAFAQLLFMYLLGTCLGSYYYRHTETSRLMPISKLLVLLAACCLLPLIINDPAVGALASAVFISAFQSIGHPLNPESVWHHVVPTLALFSVVPCSFVFGYLTPRLIDEYAAGDAATAGAYYAVNTVGCIAGPLVASYLLLPFIGSKTSLVLLSIPFAVFIARMLPLKKSTDKLAVGFMSLAFICAIPATTYEDLPSRFFANCILRRDYAATVANFGEGFHRNLMVNGQSVTSLSQCTKNMAHLPLAALPHPPESALVICFGMGTTYRSLLTWNIHVNAAELVPSVVKSFPFFHANAADVLNNPRGTIFVDDGRRFLSRTDDRYDVITIDPSPVMEKGCMSLLFSTEFLELVKKHLKPNGIFQMFIGQHEEKTSQAVLRSLVLSFPYVRAFNEPKVGVYCLCSERPIDLPSDPAQLVAKMPSSAINDLAEWSKAKGDVNRESIRILDWVLSHEIIVDKALNPDRSIKVTDDRPYNEYFFLRNTIDRMNGTFRDLEGSFTYVQAAKK
jgi:spermidine synthase